MRAACLAGLGFLAMTSGALAQGDCRELTAGCLPDPQPSLPSGDGWSAGEENDVGAITEEDFQALIRENERRRQRLSPPSGDRRSAGERDAAIRAIMEENERRRRESAPPSARVKDPTTRAIMEADERRRQRRSPSSGEEADDTTLSILQGNGGRRPTQPRLPPPPKVQFRPS